jgi:cadmium resistance protein CadD (predicted permease)
MDTLSLVVLGMTAFAATNVDDILILTLFFSDRRFRARYVCLGQALGIGLLVLLSLAGALLALAIPEQWIGLLGLLPIALGVRELLTRRGAPPSSLHLDQPSVPAANGWRQSAAVAGVTVASGGDNIGVYVPLFAGRPANEVAVLLAVFVVMLAVWLWSAYYLARRSVLARSIQRAGAFLTPWALIALGIIILVEAFLPHMLY